MVQLRWAAKLDQLGACNPDLPAGMTAVEYAIRTIWQFTQKQPALMESDGAAAVIGRLHAAIVDLADGHVSPLFQGATALAGKPGLGPG